MTPLYDGCRDCRDNPVYRTRQRRLGRSFEPAWRQCCDRHRPGAAAGVPADAVLRFHEVEPYRKETT